MERPTIDTNVVGWTFVIDILYHIFEQQDFGHLVAITSAGGLRGEPMAPAYSATKAYQINYIEALRKKSFKRTYNRRNSQVVWSLSDYGSKGQESNEISTLEF